MKVVAISDTHGQHGRVFLPEAEMIIHAGDFTRMGEENEVIEFLSWFNQLNYKHKIFIAGNHDHLFERKPEKIKELIPYGVIYLENSMVEIEGIRIYGSPITPEFNNWAFNRKRGAEIREVWRDIPANLDVLITHGPAMRILDQNTHGNFCGCLDLRERIYQVKPLIHICGHIHSGFGRVEQDGISFMNVSVLNEYYELANPPTAFNI